ncbi:hypothetical protein FOA52_012856 [Chlamydomonas sp. UWO 241]|nr:hypothetical protein FOA52_012856 [Chlamydomonas sp. UWO 241]
MILPADFDADLPTFALTGGEVKTVSAFKYLGSWITQSGGVEKEIGVRVGRALGVFASFDKIWASKKMQVCAKKRLRETQARWFFQQLILAIDFCHRRGVANRDIKLENCLLHDEEGLPHPLLKLCDFGYSKADFRSAAKTHVGTLSYMAPEVVKSHGQLYNAKLADLWSAGVVLYVMLFGVYPFDLDENLVLPESQRSALMLERMDSERYAIPATVVLSSDCGDILSQLLKPEPSQRITLEQVC